MTRGRLCRSSRRSRAGFAPRRQPLLWYALRTNPVWNGAWVCAYLVASSSGSLIALMIAPTIIGLLGLFPVMLGCAGLIIGAGLGGFLVLGFGTRVAEVAKS